MRAFQMQAIGQAAFRDLLAPRLGQAELLLRPIVTGICSTDVHVLNEGAAGVRDFPVTMGHEVVGEVVEIGDLAAGFAVGDHVVVEPLLPCGGCEHCRRGLPNLCQSSTHLGITRHGCFADLVTVPARQATIVSGIDPLAALMIEPLACALHFVTKTSANAGDTVVVLGAGPAGLLTMQAAKVSGLTVVVSEPSAFRRNLANDLGADAVVDPTREDVGDVVNRLTGGLGARAVIEVSGVPSVVSQAVSLAAPGSTVVLAGVCGHATVGVDTDRIVAREVCVVGALASRWQFGRARQLVMSGAVDVTRAVSGVHPLGDVGRMLSVVRDDKNIGKILLDHRLDDSGVGE